MDELTMHALGPPRKLSMWPQIPGIGVDISDSQRSGLKDYQPAILEVAECKLPTYMNSVESGPQIAGSRFTARMGIALCSSSVEVLC
jgi:hypothetical protein